MCIHGRERAWCHECNPVYRVKPLKWKEYEEFSRALAICPCYPLSSTLTSRQRQIRTAKLADMPSTVVKEKRRDRGSSH